MRRVILIVLDSLGIGALPDAAAYGDEGTNTLGSIIKANPNLKVPHLRRMGFGCIDGISGIQRMTAPTASFIRLAEASKGKDTITGHWEIAGLYTETPFKTFERFPDGFMKAFEEAIGTETLGNYPASGTEILKALGPKHKETGKPIIYTSADSVFQVAANTDVIPLERLYEICEIAREMLTGDLQVGRVIARPFTEKDGVYTRTSDRKDYAVSPSGRTVLDHIHDIGQKVYAIGKIGDIFNGQGVDVSVHTDNNQDGITKTVEAAKQDFGGLIFTNLVDFDSQYGHRRDPLGYGKCLEEFDERLPDLILSMKKEDLMILCADHGNDPGHSGWDHTREYIPTIFYGKLIKPGLNLGTGESFSDIAATIADYLQVEPPKLGKSWYRELSAAVPEE
ncbi:MAG: phosphopentomutase [Eubacteriales bacterium]|nr:phosphopentomutase [Eubacteriales bacterium]MDD3350135.1 phosphopentomutase [Eubacteriales bacterium]